MDALPSVSVSLQCFRRFGKGEGQLSASLSSGQYTIKRAWKDSTFPWTMYSNTFIAEMAASIVMKAYPSHPSSAHGLNVHHRSHHQGIVSERKRIRAAGRAWYMSYGFRTKTSFTIEHISSRNTNL